MSVNIQIAAPRRVLLTMEHVEGWQAEAAEIAAEIAALKARAEALNAKLAAAALFMEGGAALVSAPQEEHEANPDFSKLRMLPRPMTALVRELFEEGTRLTAAQVVAKLSEDPAVAERAEKNTNNIYTALNRLTNRDNILTRDADGVYMLASANEPPSGVTAGGSGAREGSDPFSFLQPQAHSDG